ncbi:MAG: branched-chain amino acid ABC transporter permease [Treponema sp.]|nr:branched-chain amino acid ABC transporter permease [Treponema sp.]
MFFQQVINGLTVGSIYALVALGYSMVYGVLQIVNWAHADVMMVGTFIGMTLISMLHVPVVAMIILAAGATALIGMGVERVAYRPIKVNRRMAVLVSALGMSVFLQNLAQLVWGSGSRPLAIIARKTFAAGSVSFTNLQIIITLVTLFMLFVLYVLVYKTKIGVAMRACSTSIENAKLMGINTNLIISATFALGSFIAGIGGVLIGAYYNSVYPTMGYLLGMKAFSAAILGGIGSIPGSVIGGYLIGLIESLGAGYISSNYRDAYSFLVMIIILALRPSGIMGAKRIDKV